MVLTTKAPQTKVLVGVLEAVGQCHHDAGLRAEWVSTFSVCAVCPARAALVKRSALG